MTNPHKLHGQRTLGSALRQIADNWDTARTEGVGGVAAICPFCGAFASFIQVTQANILASALATHEVGRCLFQARCPACQGLAVIASSYTQDSKGNQRLTLALLWPPELRSSRAPSSLDPAARKDYDEARSTLAASPTASAVLSRRCLQRVLREKMRVKNGRLQDEVAEAVNNPELTKPTRDGLDHIRKVGNWGAHPVLDYASSLIDVTPEEAEYTLDILELLFHDLYDAPERIAAMDARLKQRSGRSAGPT